MCQHRGQLFLQLQRGKCASGSTQKIELICKRKSNLNFLMKEDELSCRRLKPEEKLAGDEVGQGARGDEGELLGEGGGQELGGVAAFRAKPAVRRLQRTVNRCITLRLRMLPMGDGSSCIPWLFQQIGREV